MKRLIYTLDFGAMLIVLAIVISLGVVLPVDGDESTPTPIVTPDPDTTPTINITIPAEEPPTAETTTKAPSTDAPPSEAPTTTTPEITTKELPRPEIPRTEPPRTEPPRPEPPRPEPPRPEPPRPEPPSPEIPITQPPTTEPPRTELDLDGILRDAYRPALFDGIWASESKVIATDYNQNLVIYDLEEISYHKLVSNSCEMMQSTPRVILLSPDGDEVALSYPDTPIYRHSFVAQYAAVNVHDGNVTRILPPGVTNNAFAILQNFMWGPSGTALAFVYLNNIYYQECLHDEPRAITTSGVVDVIFNGVPDWVYEEEVFASNNAMWFSADGSKLAYVSFNDTNVGVVEVPHYLSLDSNLYQYTHHHNMRYPKAGTTNPTVSVIMHDVNTDKSTTFEVPEDLDQPIVKPPVFVNNDTIAVMWTNRVQTTFVVELCTYSCPSCSRIFSYTETNGWVDNIPMIFNEQGNAFITILPAAVDGVRYKQIMQVSHTDHIELWTMKNRINRNHTVIDIIRWTSDDVIWYKATSETDATEQHVYSVSADGFVFCFTCSLYTNGDCRFNDGDLSKDGKLINIDCLGPNMPFASIYNTSSKIQTWLWRSNHQLASKLKEVVMPLTIYETVHIADGLPDADVQIQVPVGYNKGVGNIPMLVYLYGGPGTALVTKEWVLDWGTYLVNRYNIAVARIDGRGSGRRGVDTLFAVNRRLGTYEIEDQIEVTRKLHEKLPWLDRNRTCTWGWSYGGYAAFLALARGNGVFRCAAAVAPAADLRYYDTIYTERFMDTPQNNSEGYERSSLLAPKTVESFRNKNFFLIHGTADDNAHIKNTMLLSNDLQKNDIFFHQMIYTDEGHYLSGVRPHLYHGLENFLKKYLL